MGMILRLHKKNKSPSSLKNGVQCVHNRVHKRKEFSMMTIGVRELRQQTSELIRLVQEEGRQIAITRRGKPVALLIPAERSPARQEEADEWLKLDHLAAEIEARWPEGVSAVEAVAEGRT
jgi:prevent-host-death family protein